MNTYLLSEKDAEIVCLTDERTSFFLNISPVSVITFFDGKADMVEEHLRTKLLSILRLNPWLLGRLAWKGKDLVLRHPTSLPADYALHEPVFSVVTDLRFTDDLTFQIQTEMAMTYTADTGNKLIKKGTAGIPLRLTLVRSAPSKFAVIFSICHSFVDGHNFYDLYAMLGLPLGSAHGGSLDRSIPRALQPVRVAGYEKERDACTGGNDALNWVMSPGGILTVLKQLLFSPRTTQSVCSLNMTVIDRMKKESLALEGKGGKDAAPWPVPFISTNDVLTSVLGTAARADVLMAAMDLRGKIPCVSNDNIGNYSTGMTYLADDLRSPGRIRRALCRPDGRFRRVHADVPLPGFWRSLSTRAAGITNWTTFYTDLVLPGAEQTSHSPIMDLAGHPLAVGYIVFCPKAGQMRVLYMTRDARLHSEIAKLEIFS